MTRKKSKKLPKQVMRRTTRNSLIAAVFFVLLPVVFVLDHRYGHQIRRAIERTTYTEADRQKYHNQTFTVVEVFDGDTIAVNVPDGESEMTHVRLIGVDTPETHHPTIGLMYYGPEATEFTTEQTLRKQVTIKLDTIGDIRDRYGRLLAYVILADGRVLNAELIKQGYGYAYLPFEHSESALYESLMQQAMTEKRGLWKSATRDDLPQWLRQKRPDLLRYLPTCPMSQRCPSPIKSPAPGASTIKN